MAACSYNYKGRQYTEEELLKHPDFTRPFAANRIEQEHIMNNTGTLHNSNLSFFPVSNSVPPEQGAFANFVEFKRTQLLEYRRRLDVVKRDKKKQDLTKEQITALNKQERVLELQIKGSYKLDKKGIMNEIEDLEELRDIDAIGFYVERDLERLTALAYSSNIDDIHEAQRLIDFYTKAGTFELGKDNPFFTEEEMFVKDADGKLTTVYVQSAELMNKFKAWRLEAEDLQSVVNKREQEITENAVNNDYSVKRTYGNKKFSFEELVYNQSGLKDTHFIDMWTMDITQGIFSTNGLLPQAMFTYLANSFEEKLSWSRGVATTIDDMSPRVQKALIKKGHSLRGSGIIGLKGASFQLYKEITKDGNETGGLVRRFVKEFFDASDTVANKFDDKFKDALTYLDYKQKTRAVNKAFEDHKRWRRQNTIMMNPALIPEISGAASAEAIAHRKELVDVLGEKGYDQHVTKQKNALARFESQRDYFIETVMEIEGVSDKADISAEGKLRIVRWDNSNNPTLGVEDYHSVTGVFFGEGENSEKANNFMNYNILVPRKNTVNIGIDKATNKYTFTDTTTSTGYYSKAYAEIEGDTDLAEFYDVVAEVCETIRENMPYSVQQGMAANTLPAMMKNSAEILADKNIGWMSALWLPFKHMIEKARMSFGVMKEGDVSYAVLDPITKRPNYKVNDQFLQGNKGAIDARMTIEKGKFLKQYNKGLPKSQQISSINRFTSIPLSSMSTSSLLSLAEYLHVNISLAEINAGKLDKIKERTGDSVQIGRFIGDYSRHSVVQSQSFDLGKICKYYSNMTMAYAARQEALPILQIMKKHYQSILEPTTTNIGVDKKTPDQKIMQYGLRTNAIKQMDDWFERVVLDNYGLKHGGVHGQEAVTSERIQKIDKRLKEIEEKLAANPNTSDLKSLIAEREKLTLKRAIPSFGSDIYSSEEKKQLKDIEDLLKDETDPEKIAELIKIKSRMGRARTATALFDNLIAWIRTLGLGYNVSSASTNLIEGVSSNMILASMGEHFDPKEIFPAYNIVKVSILKNVSFGLIEAGASRKNRKLMDRYSVIMDSRNELQKSSHKSFASKLSWAGPHEINQRVEFLNQSPLMIAMLRTIKIEDENGNKSSVWDAMDDKTGLLTGKFRTEKNINNWEKLKGEDYLVFKQSLNKAIVKAHGNYDELRGMMMKSKTAGKALAMFKTWLPMQLYSRFAIEQDDIQTGSIGYKGKYWSYGAGGAFTHIGVVATIASGPIAGVIWGLGGAIAGGLFGVNKGQSFSIVDVIKEVIYTNIQLFKKAVGMPINLLAGKQLIGSDKSFEKWVGKKNFDKQDAANMRANMADLSLQLAWMAGLLIVKALWWDDDKEKQKELMKKMTEQQKKDFKKELADERAKHNIAANKLMQLSQGAGQYINAPDLYNSIIGSNGVIRYLEETKKWIETIGNDEAKFRKESKKMFLPGIFKDPTSLGLETLSERQFKKSPFDEWFQSASKKATEQSKAERSERRAELQEEGLGEAEIRKILDKELPTPSQLRKKNRPKEK